MIDLKDLINNKETYIESFKNKNTDLKKDVDRVISLYKKYSKLLNDEQKKREELNRITNEIKSSPKDMSLKTSAKKISSEAKIITTEVSKLIDEINNIASYFPNITNDNVPIGKDEKQIHKTSLRN